MATVAKRKRRRRVKDGDEAMEKLVQEVHRWTEDCVARHEGFVGFYGQRS